jgi:hypothetical protein
MVDNNRRYLAGSYLVVLALGMALYIASCSPGAVWQDSGMIQYRVWHNDIEGSLGLALSHPLFYMIAIAAKYIPLGEFGYRVNMATAIISAVAVANLFLLLRLWLGKTFPAIIGAATLALSHTFWQHASIPETYNLTVALLICELIMLLQYAKTGRVGWLYLLGFTNGLAIANHMLASIAFVCYLVYLITLLTKKQINLKHFGVIAVLWVIGAAPYEYLIIRNIIETGDFCGTLKSAAFGASWQGAALNIRISTRLVKENLILMAYNFSTPNVIFFLTGLYVLKKVSPSRSFANVLLALLILFFVFAFRYTVPDRYAFFMPFYCLVSIFIGIGIYHFLSRRPHKLYIILILAFAFLPLLIYESVPKIAERLKINLGTKRTIPYRNEYTYFLRPWQCGNNGPELFASEALKGVEKDAIIIADGTTVYALWYIQKIKGINTSANIVAEHKGYKNPFLFPAGDTIDDLLAQKPVYVVLPVAGYCPQFLLERYEFKQSGVLWKVVN